MSPTSVVRPRVTGTSELDRRMSRIADLASLADAFCSAAGST